MAGWRELVGALQSRGWSETQGTVTRSVVVRRRMRREVHYEPAVRYTYWVAGKELTGERRNFDVMDAGSFETARAAVERLPVGSSQRVYYDAAAPRRSTLARDVPSVFWVSLAWLVVALLGVAVAALGGDIVVAAFMEPPELGELPSLLAQLGGLLLGVGALALVYSGIRAMFEREARQLLRFVASAKPARAGEIRAGDRVALFGRAEPDSEIDGEALDLPFGERALFYVHTDLGSPDSKLTQATPFVLRDETGAVQVDLIDGHSLLGKQRVAIQGEVEQWLDRYELGLGDSVSGDRRPTMHVERVHEGDSILIVARAFAAGPGLVLRGQEDEAHSLVFADEPLAKSIERLKKKPRVTRALAGAGALAMVTGALALLI